MAPFPTEPVELDELDGQFCLAETGWGSDRVDGSETIDGWTLTTFGSTPSIPVIRDDQPVGWIVGRVDGTLEADVQLDGGQIRIGQHTTSTGAAAISQSLVGSFCVILVDADRPSVALDACGTVPSVFSPSTRRLASTPLALGQDLERETWAYSESQLINDAWYPFGLTGFRDVTRLQPHYVLDLTSFTLERFWPTGPFTTDGGLDAVVDALRASIRPLLDRSVTVRLPLTAGRDSRLLFGIALAEGLSVSAYTLLGAGSSVDRYVAARLCRRTGTPFETYRLERRNQDELDAWFRVTGHCVGGKNVVFKQPEALFSEDFLEVSGVGGEIARGFLWRSSDTSGANLDDNKLIGRLLLPPTEVFLDEASRWLDEVREYDLYTTLDLAYIEQRTACWAEPQMYGSRKRHRQVSPYFQWPFLEAALRLPLDIRRDDAMSPMILETVAPELLELPYGTAPIWVQLGDKLSRSRDPSEWIRRYRRLRSR